MQSISEKWYINRKCVYSILILGITLFLTNCAGIQYSDQVQAIDLLKSNKNQSSTRVLAKAEEWRNSGVVLQQGHTYKVVAKGRWSAGPPCGWTGPDGIGWSSFCIEEYKGWTGSTLMAKIGVQGFPFGIGAQYEFEAQESGVLYFRMNDIKGFCGDNAGYVDATTSIISGKNQYAKKAVDPAQHKTTIHVAYPKEGEQIADERITLLGYVTSANKTKSLKLFVNRKRQFVDELWRGSPIETIGLRGYPLDLSVPIEKGKNIIEIRVLDHEGFMVNHRIEVNRIEIAETQVASSVSLGRRLPDLESKPQDKQVNEKNFAVVIEDWVKQTAVSDYNKGNRMYDDGRLERAAYYYRKSVRTDPIAPAFFNLGLALKGIGNEHDARQAFVKACEQKEERACDMISQ